MNNTGGWPVGLSDNGVSTQLLLVEECQTATSQGSSARSLSTPKRTVNSKSPFSIFVTRPRGGKLDMMTSILMAGETKLDRSPFTFGRKRGERFHFYWNKYRIWYPL